MYLFPFFILCYFCCTVIHHFFAHASWILLWMPSWLNGGKWGNIPYFCVQCMWRTLQHSRGLRRHRNRPKIVNADQDAHLLTFGPFPYIQNTLQDLWTWFPRQRPVLTLPNQPWSIELMVDPIPQNLYQFSALSFLPFLNNGTTLAPPPVFQNFTCH